MTLNRYRGAASTVLTFTLTSNVRVNVRVSSAPSSSATAAGFSTGWPPTSWPSRATRKSSGSRVTSRIMRRPSASVSATWSPSGCGTGSWGRRISKAKACLLYLWSAFCKENAVFFTYYAASGKQNGFCLPDAVFAYSLLYMTTTSWQPTDLPPVEEVETRAVLKKLPAARSALAELKGISKTIPNEQILLNTLPLQEAKDSSAVENIITTHDELFEAALQTEGLPSQATKEVSNYAAALRLGVELVQQYGFLSVNHLARIQAELEQNSGGYRRLPGTTLRSCLS